MNVIVCDDDKATRFAVKRILTQNFGITVTECSDGLEAIQTLSRGRFAFIVIDLEMPTMGGIEAVELLRESEVTRTLPIVVLSNVRDGDSIEHLVRLGVSDYILKPPRTDRIVPKIQRLLKVLPKMRTEARSGSTVRLSPEVPAMIVDGSLDFRFVLGAELQRYGTVQEADSGATAVARFRDLPASLVFVGQELGIVGAELLVKKLRQASPDGPLRIVGVVPDVDAAPQGLFDDVIPRTFVPAVLKAALRPFVEIPGPMSALCQIVPDFLELAISAATQSFGMMFDAEVTTSDVEGPTRTSANASIEIDVDDRLSVTVSVLLSDESATGVAAKMFGGNPEDVTDEDRQSVAGEIANLVVGRVHANLRERDIKSVCTLPRVLGPMDVTVPAETDGVLSRLTVSGAGELILSVVVVDYAAAARQQAAAQLDELEVPAAS